MTEARRAELQALLTRASVEEARKQSALARGDRFAVAECEIELARLHSRWIDLLGERFNRGRQH